MSSLATCRTLSNVRYGGKPRWTKKETERITEDIMTEIFPNFI